MTKDEVFVRLFEIVRWDYEKDADMRYPIPYQGRDVGKYVAGLLQQAGEYISAPLECGYACAYVPPYGWVPEADCPIHDNSEPT